MDDNKRKKNAEYQRAHRAKNRGEAPGRLGVRLDVVISPTSKQRLKELADAADETEKFTLEAIIKNAHDQMKGECAENNVQK